VTGVKRMEWFVVGADTWERLMTGSATDRCLECGEAFFYGDVVVTFNQGPRVLVQPDLYFHRHHFDELLAAAPSDRAAVEAEIAELHRQVRATGMTPVEAILNA
jgi:hypothetical protein